MSERVITRICFEGKITHLGGDDWWCPVEDVLQDMSAGLRQYVVNGILGKEKLVAVRSHGAFGGYVRANINETEIDNLTRMPRFDKGGRKEIRPYPFGNGLGIRSWPWT